MSTKVILPKDLSTIRTLGPIVGVAGLVAGAVLAVLFGGIHYFFEAFFYSFWILLGLSLGSLAFTMIHHMTAGAWSFVSQRIFEALMRTLPVLIVGFVVLIMTGPLFGLNNLYDAWAGENPSPIVGKKADFLNPVFWTLRSLVYFGIWGLIIVAFNRWSRQLEETGDALITLKFRTWAPVCLIAYCLTMTFAGTDWAMSLEPEWFSTMYGPLTWISQGLTVLAFTILILSSLAEEKPCEAELRPADAPHQPVATQQPLSRYITVEHYHTLATLMCGFVVLWAYMSFSQFLIIWAGNLPEEIPYYLHRRTGYYQVIIFLLMVGHFFLPLLVLLQRKVKYSLSKLRVVCYWMLGMRLVDVFFVINPAFHGGDMSFPFKDLIVHAFVLVGFGGIYMWYFLGELTKMPLLPMNDPRLYKAVRIGASASCCSATARCSATAVGHGEGEEAAEHA